MSWAGGDWLTVAAQPCSTHAKGCPRSQAHGCHAAGAEDGRGGPLWPGREGEQALACSEGAGTTLQPGLQI